MRKVLRWILYAVGLIALGTVLFDGYARLPSRVDVRPARLDPDTRAAVLLFHGRNGRDEPTLIALTARFRELTRPQVEGQAAARPALDQRPGAAVLRYIWSPHSDTRFRSAPNGDRVGRVLGAELAQLPRLATLHLVAQSAGAYVLEPLCEAYRDAVTAAGRRPARIEMTYLDPIGFRGVLDVGYGARNYGQCADYAEAFINTDDPVPATDTPLEHAWNVDVTAAPARAGYQGGGHRWPAQYYLNQLTAADLEPGAHDHATRPRGAVERR